MIAVNTGWWLTWSPVSLLAAQRLQEPCSAQTPAGKFACARHPQLSPMAVLSWHFSSASSFLKTAFFCPSLHICFSFLCHGNILEIQWWKVLFGINVSVSMCHIHGCHALLAGTQGCLLVGNMHCSRVVDPPWATEVGPGGSRNGPQR